MTDTLAFAALLAIKTHFVLTKLICCTCFQIHTRNEDTKIIVTMSLSHRKSLSRKSSKSYSQPSHQNYKQHLYVPPWRYTIALIRNRIDNCLATLAHVSVSSEETFLAFSRLCLKEDHWRTCHFNVGTSEYHWFWTSLLMMLSVLWGFNVLHFWRIGGSAPQCLP